MANVEQKTDAEWEAEGDAVTLATADQILNDDKRLKAAKKAAATMAKATADRLVSLLKVVGKLDDKVEGMKLLKT